jgi:hypothetical protein
MLPAQQVRAGAPAAKAPGTLIGKRYVDAADTLELLCAASGAGPLTHGSGGPVLTWWTPP